MFFDNTYIITALKRMSALAWRVLPAVGLSLTMGACSDSADEPLTDSPAEDDGISVSIVIGCQNQGNSTSRAAAGDDSEDLAGDFGTFEENYINPNSTYIMTFSIEDIDENGIENTARVLTGNSRLLEILWSPDIAKNPGNAVVTTSGDKVNLTTKLDATKPEYQNDNDFCVVALANVWSAPGCAPRTFTPANWNTFGELQKSASSFLYWDIYQPELKWAPTADPNKTNCMIPMFGVKKVNLKGYNPKIHSEWNPYQLMSESSSPLWLLRSFAKVSITLSEELQNLIINGEDAGVKFTKANLRKAGTDADGYSANYSIIPTLGRMSGFSLTGGTGQVISAPDELTLNRSDRKVGFTISNDGKSACIYIPEYDLDKDPIDINLSISVNGAENDYSFRFQKYQDDENTVSDELMWKYILRNHSYRFEVSLDFRLISVSPTQWGDAFDNDFNFG